MDINTYATTQRHETPVYSFCNFNNMLKTLLSFRVGNIKEQPKAS